uniref:Uncharacterized protein n=1 Tax=Leersia perrieri TaxID=77586 RepID=A0A0D9W2L7_9ORYZ
MDHMSIQKHEIAGVEHSSIAHISDSWIPYLIAGWIAKRECSICELEDRARWDLYCFLSTGAGLGIPNDGLVSDLVEPDSKEV